MRRLLFAVTVGPPPLPGVREIATRDVICGRWPGAADKLDSVGHTTCLRVATGTAVGASLTPGPERTIESTTRSHGL